MLHFVDYGTLFAAAFLSATVLPFGSEAVLFGLLVAERSSARPWLPGVRRRPVPRQKCLPFLHDMFPGVRRRLLQSSVAGGERGGEEDGDGP
jgi:hypothetical protein